MKQILIAFFFVFTLSLYGEAPPHLILHFDVNKTLIASDQTENKSLEDVINEMLSRKYSSCWDERVLKPISFDAYVRKILLPGEEHDVTLKMTRLVYLTHFLDYLKEKTHLLYPTVLNEFNTVIETLEGAHIFPSFFRLLTYLENQGISYTLFLRSFGKEVFEIKQQINAIIGQLNQDESVDNELFQIEAKFRQGELHVEGEEPLKTPEEIYAFFSSGKHAAVHDDWHYWMKGEMLAKYGKPLYLNLDDRKTLTLFFDDNIKFCSHGKCIVGPLDSSTGDVISTQFLLKSKQMIFVDTLEAILNENYFIERVEEALQEHAFPEDF